MLWDRLGHKDLRVSLIFGIINELSSALARSFIEDNKSLHADKGGKNSVLIELFFFLQVFPVHPDPQVHKVYQAL